MNDAIGMVGVFVFIALLVIIGPLLVIWSLNTLFVLGIPYNFFTWISIVILAAAVRGNVNVKVNN